MSMERRVVCDRCGAKSVRDSRREGWHRVWDNAWCEQADGHPSMEGTPHDLCPGCAEDFGGFMAEVRGE